MRRRVSASPMYVVFDGAEDSGGDQMSWLESEDTRYAVTTLLEE